MFVFHNDDGTILPLCLLASRPFVLLPSVTSPPLHLISCPPALHFVSTLFIFHRAPPLLTTQCAAGSVPAHYAATYGHNHIIAMLAERDPASLMVQDSSGGTLLLSVEAKNWGCAAAEAFDSAHWGGSVHFFFKIRKSVALFPSLSRCTFSRKKLSLSLTKTWEYSPPQVGQDFQNKCR